jgi:hypothetical protein
MSSMHERIIDEFEKRGLKFFREVLYSSAFQISDLPRVRSLIAENGFDNVDVALLRLDEGTIHRYFPMQLCTIEGQFMQYWLAVELPTPTKLNFLKLTLAFSSEEDMENADFEITKLVNLLRVIFGTPAAKEQQFQGAFSKDNIAGQQILLKGFASYFDSQGLNLFNIPPIEEARLRPMTKGIATLLESAFTQRYPEVQFVLMWLALEAVVNSFPGGSNNGEKRKRYFLHELGSSAANQEVKRLHDLRGNIFKQGDFLPQKKLSMATWSLYWVLQLAMLDACPQRDEFLKGFELFLATERSSSNDWGSA